MCYPHHTHLSFKIFFFWFPKKVRKYEKKYWSGERCLRGEGGGEGQGIGDAKKGDGGAEQVSGNLRLAVIPIQ